MTKLEDNINSQTINNTVKRGTVRTIKQRQMHHNKVYEYDKYSYWADADHLIACTSTPYDWIDRGIMKTKNIDLLEKISRKTRRDSSTYRENRRVLGMSIAERPPEVDDRLEFGHWELTLSKVKC